MTKLPIYFVEFDKYFPLEGTKQYLSDEPHISRPQFQHNNFTEQNILHPCHMVTYQYQNQATPTWDSRSLPNACNDSDTNISHCYTHTDHSNQSNCLEYPISSSADSTTYSSGSETELTRATVGLHWKVLKAPFRISHQRRRTSKSKPQSSVFSCNA